MPANLKLLLTDKTMSRKQQLKKAKKELKSTEELKGEKNLITASPADFNKVKWGLALLLALFAFLLYAQTITFDYTLDDNASIRENKIVTQGIQGIPTLLSTDYWYGYSEKLRGTQYRPASLVMFAVEWSLFPDNAHVSHFINVLLYALTCFLLFILLSKLLRQQNLLLPFLCTLLFAAHPIHTEVVSNIKSRDELLCFLFSIAALLSGLQYYLKRSVACLILTGLFFFLALLSKETGMSFLLVIPLCIYVFREITFKEITLISIILLVFAGIYLFIRWQVIQNIPAANLQIIDNSIAGAENTGSRLATAFYVLCRYIGLLIIPHPLSYDYSFAQIQLKTFADPVAILGMIVYISIAVFAFLNLTKKNWYAFAILFYLLTLAPVSNIFLLIGSTMAERFLYIPSLGFCLVVSLLLIKLSKANLYNFKYDSIRSFALTHVTIITIVSMLTVVYSFKTISRSRDWKNNVSLFGHDVNISVNSARTQYNWGVSLILDLYNKEEDFTTRKEYLEQSRLALEKAIEIYPAYLDAHKSLGFVYLKQGNYTKAVTNLDVYLAANPIEVAAYNNKAAALMGLQNYAAAIPVLQKAIEINPSDTSAIKNLGRSYAYNNEYAKAVEYFLKCIELAPGVADNYRLAGMAYNFMGDTARAKPFLEKALAMNKN